MDPNVTLNFSDSLRICLEEDAPQAQHALFQVAQVFLFMAFFSPSTKKGLLFMHLLLLMGFFLYSMWAWNVICDPKIFSWNFIFVLLNMGQALNVLYAMRKVKFSPELEDIYRTLFQPFQVSRLTFQRLVNPDCGQVISLHPGEAYAMQGLTRTDRLGLLVSGRVNVISGKHFLHHIQSKEFLDSPEFESSRSGVEERFRVSVVATCSCRCVVWQRSNLEHLLIKETHLAAVLALLLSSDVTRKLYAMNDKMVTETGSHLDIRLPSLTGSIASQEEETKKKIESVFDSKEGINPGQAHVRPFQSV